jgi:hypothetical protein
MSLESLFTAAIADNELTIAAYIANIGRMRAHGSEHSCWVARLNAICEMKAVHLYALSDTCPDTCSVPDTSADTFALRTSEK